jgi:hypothetical protein
MSNPPVLNGRAIKLSVLLNPAEIITLVAPERQPRIRLQIKAGGRNISADIATKSLRKAISTLHENGADSCVILIQGKLGLGDVVEECGLVAQVKTGGAKD